ncbi:oxygen-insensitive NADPH nitroreductase [Thermotalea metallivorans]|uniref:FMN reductase (NADPH) n=1 Tax=Thermotalea metallivorans TaxID=520762 RepID=A0A140L0N7_9FIRM|nr:oxygen-insensitive NADPH nitroreductase [Thermotalea metallivorans]KXG74112.1 FMN reductase (NADPH) [Thermotalea metallivorans]
MNEVIRFMKSHRSIRKFTDKPIEDHLLKEIIESAQWASSSTFVQAYSIIGIKNPQTKKRLAYLCGEQPYIASCPVFLVFCADLHRLKMACEIHGTEMVGEYTESFIMATVDTALASQNAMLAAESLGLGGVYIGGIRNNPQEVSELLKLPEHVYPVFGICLGYPAEDPERKPRLPVEVVYKEEIYDDRADLEKIREYDKVISEYYLVRTKGKRNDTWTRQMAEKMQKETRPHMKEFLTKRGFLMK